MARMAQHEVIRELERTAGSEVRLTFEGDPMYGVTLRWAVLRELRLSATRDSVAVFDGYHDSAGIAGQYPDHKPDGVEVPLASILEVRPTYRSH